MKFLDSPRSGSLAGTTASRNRFGQYLRTRAIPVNPASPLQSNTRSLLGNSAASWSAINDQTRAAWEDCAKRFPKVDSLGQTYFLSGFQQYIRANQALKGIGEAGQNVPLPDTSWTSPVIVPTVEAGTTPVFEFTYQPIKAKQFLVVDVSGMVNAGRSYWSDYRQLAIQGQGSLSPAEELAKYTLRYGPLLAGARIFFRSRVLNECGVYSAPAYVNTLVGAGTVIPLAAAEGESSAPRKARK